MKARYVEIGYTGERFSRTIRWENGPEEEFGVDREAREALDAGIRNAEFLGCPLFATVEAQIALDRAGAFRAEVPS